MPLYEYECALHGKVEKFFPTFREAKEHEDETQCPHEGFHHVAKRIMSVPCEAMLYGDPAGYHKPSPTKRYSTKLVSAKTGNESAVG